MKFFQYVHTKKQRHLFNVTAHILLRHSITIIIFQRIKVTFYAIGVHYT